jgi:hypothetical protein
MESTLLFIFGCMLSLMFLGMLYGERLNLLGLFDGELLSPVGVTLSRLWNGLCEFVDYALHFLLGHLSWVIAAASGTAGLILVAFLMGGGLASDAVAYHRDVTKPLKSGGVMDVVREVPTSTRLSAAILASENDLSDIVRQERSFDYALFGRPEYSLPRPRPRRPIEGGRVDDIAQRPSLDPPDLSVRFRRLSSSMLLMDDVGNVETEGRLVDAWPDPAFVDRALRRLLRDDWREGLPDRGGDGEPRQDGLPESPLADVRRIEMPVTVTPGIFVAEHDLRVTKEVPEESATGEVTIVVNLRNMGQETIDGLLVREILPLRTIVRGAEPEGVLRDDTLTWRVDNLRPAEDFQLRVTVLPAAGLAGDIDSVFSSRTEVSATTAVIAQTAVRDDQPAPFPSDRRIRSREMAGIPDLRLTIEAPETAVNVGQSTDVYFSLTNAGTASATNVRLRLTLDDNLEHSDLAASRRSLRDPADRQVYVEVNRIDAGQTRRFRLAVQPTTAGRTLSTAEVLMDGQSIGRRSFLLAAENSVPRR